MKVLMTLLTCALMLVGLTGCSEQVAFGEEVSDDVSAADSFLLSAADHPQEWRTHGGTYAEQRYSTLRQIDESNVKKLGLAATEAPPKAEVCYPTCATRRRASSTATRRSSSRVV